MRSICSIWGVWLMTGSALFAQEAAVEIVGSDRIRAVRLDDSLYDPVELPLVIRTTAGPHVLHVYGFNRDRYSASDFTERFQLTPGEVRRIEAFVQPLGLVNSIPFGASIWLGDSLAGETPLWMPLARLKDRQLVVKKSGYADVSVSIGDTAVERHHLWITLNSATGYVEPDNEFLSASWRDRGIGRNRGLLIASTITGLLAGGVAAYYKIKADDLFEEAKLAHRRNNLAREASLRKKTKRYDRIALVGFIGMQVSFGGAVYLFLKSE